MSRTYEKTIDNTTVVQLERANQFKEVLTGCRYTDPSPEVKEILVRMAVLEIIS